MPATSTLFRIRWRWENNPSVVASWQRNTAPRVVPRELSLSGAGDTCWFMGSTAGARGDLFFPPCRPRSRVRALPETRGEHRLGSSVHPRSASAWQHGQEGPGLCNLLTEEWCHLPSWAPYLAGGQAQAAGGVVPSFSAQERHHGPFRLQSQPGLQGQSCGNIAKAPDLGETSSQERH